MHQVTEQTKKLVSTKFAEVGLTVTKEGTLTADVIEKNKLIDNHYYAIANKVGCWMRCWPGSHAAALG